MEARILWFGIVIAALTYAAMALVAASSDALPVPAEVDGDLELLLVCVGLLP